MLNLDIFNTLMHIYDVLDEPWGIKDSASRHIYMNQAARIYTNIPPKFSIEGRLDAEFPVSWSELAEDLIEHDRLTEKSARRVTVIETHYWSGHQFIAPYLSEKIPIYDQYKKCIGTVWNAKELDNLTPLKYINQQKPTVIQTDLTTDLFTKAELMLIFFALQRYSSKEISKRLNISPKTVENKLYTLYHKTETHSLSQFIDYCKSRGWDNYIPYEFIVKGIQFI